ncbi:MAG: hypothetical protein M1821_001429 [Bathelium mastoideum]|nr:MAG: hypothetical protein M1821_001429 [Bathelium mastoideum]
MYTVLQQQQQQQQQLSSIERKPPYSYGPLPRTKSEDVKYPPSKLDNQKHNGSNGLVRFEPLLPQGNTRVGTGSSEAIPSLNSTQHLLPDFTPTATRQSDTIIGGPAWSNGTIDSRLSRRRPAGDEPKTLHHKRQIKVRKYSPHSYEDDAPVSNPFLRPLRNPGFIRPTYVLPTPEDYPEAPRFLFEERSLSAEFWQHIGLWDRLYVSYPGGVGMSPVKQICVVEVVGEEHLRHVARGEGLTKRDAREAALLHLQSKLHLSGALRSLLDPASLSMATQRYYMHNVYNDAARFGLIPRLEIQDGMTCLGLTQTKRVVTVTIIVEELGIRASAQGPVLSLAESAAAYEFQRLFEQRKKYAKPPPLYRSVSMASAKKFFQTYKTVRKDDWIEVHRRSNVPMVPGSQAKDLELNSAVVMINNQAVGQEVFFASPVKADNAAYLTAALSLVKKDPHLISLFGGPSAQAFEKSTQPRDPSPVSLILDLHPDSIQLMREASDAFREARDSQGVEQARGTVEMEWAPPARPRARLIERHVQARNMILKERQAELDTGAAFTVSIRAKTELPVRQHATQILEMVNNNLYSIVVGATGSGKTTQVPQLLLEQAIVSGEGARCNIVCTQPRRIAAKSVARRVAQERNENLQNTVGYQVRFDSKPPMPGGSINYCTTGTLLAQLESAADEILDGLTHIVLDEVHERDMSIDFLMVVLKKTLAARQQAGKSVPRIVLMSATVDIDSFAQYFPSVSASGQALLCPSISVPGQLFPIEEHFLDDILKDLRVSHAAQFEYLMRLDKPTTAFLEVEESFMQNPAPNVLNWDQQIMDRSDAQKILGHDEMVANMERETALIPINLIGATIAHIVKKSPQGAILVFLPGMDEIFKVEKLLLTHLIFGVDFKQAHRFKIIKLHSDLPDGQIEVFEPTPPECRKIILATNIAETSITIPEIQFVVDSGKMREKQYSQIHRISRLMNVWESKSNRKQRAGRAGRVQSGHYFGLFSKARSESFAASALPELLRTDLQSLCLSVKVHSKHASIRDFLADAIEPPTSVAVDASIRSLQALQALSEGEELTPLGHVLARLPVHPALGKMIVLGIIFKCLDPMLIMGAAQDERPFFYSPLERREEADKAHAEFYEDTNSDQIAIINGYRELRQLRNEQGPFSAETWARQRFFHMGAFMAIDRSTEQIESVLVDAGLIPRIYRYEREYSELGPAKLNENAGDVAIVKALAVAGLYPNLAVHAGGTLKTVSEPKTIIHPTSANASKRKYADAIKRNSVLAYADMLRSADGGSLLLKETTVVTPLTALLFGGRLDMKPGGVIQMDKWLSYHIRGDPSVAAHLLRFRESLDTLLSDAFSNLSKQDTKSFMDDPARDRFADALTRLLADDLRRQRALRAQAT